MGLTDAQLVSLISRDRTGDILQMEVLAERKGKREQGRGIDTQERRESHDPRRGSVLSRGGIKFCCIYSDSVYDSMVSFSFLIFLKINFIL